MMFLQLKVVPEITNVKIFQRIMDIIKIHVGIKLLLQMPSCICRIYISKKAFKDFYHAPLITNTCRKILQKNINIRSIILECLSSLIFRDLTEKTQIKENPCGNYTLRLNIHLNLRKTR